MKFDYRREIKHNYLIIDPEELFWQGYESQMLSRNQIEGILRFQIRKTDEGTCFYYEITSRQPLSRILGNRNIRADEIRRLVIGIFSVLERMEPYLLGEGNVLLNPEYLYVEPDTFRVWLCLIPGLKKNFPEDFSKLLEYLLGCVDHQDRDSVVLAYGLYQETRKENYGLEDIMRLLRQGKSEHKPKNQALKNSDNEKESESEENELKSRNHGKTENQGKKAQNFRNSSFEKKKGNGNEENNRIRKNIFQKQDIHEEHKSKNNWKKYWHQWKKRVFSGNGQEEENLPVHAPWEMMFQSEEEESSPPSFGNQHSYSLSTRVIPQSQTTGRGTVLLADFSEESGQRMLRALDIDGEDIPISYYPFIIGKQENLVDFKLDRDTVSRLHLRIDQENGSYHIKDLNSTNGTLLRGRLLENNEEAELHTGDEIRIAKYRYRFE